MSLTEKQIQRRLDEAWLNLGDTSKLSIDNPLMNRTKKDIENPHLYILGLMRKPEYFWWTCKVIFNIELLPMQCVVLWELWHRPFPMLVCSRGFGKSFMLALYILLRELLCQGCKIAVVGASFRQAKHVFEYCDMIWGNAPILREMVGATGDKKQGPRRDVDRCNMWIGASKATFLPLGDGTKIRGERANYIIAEEFASIPREIFEVVVGGFNVVSSSPISNVKDRAKIKTMKELGLYNQQYDDKKNKGRFNQTILSGTAFYDFNHFSYYHKRWKDIIESKGDPNKLERYFPDGISAGFDWRDYSIIKIPYELIPEGFMDEKQIARARASVHSSIYAMEYGTCFVKDSDGFFKRSLIEQCVTKEPIQLPSGPVQFSATTCGNPNCVYIYGIDPASERDNFSIGILEIHPDHRRIVYCWTTTRKSHVARVKSGLIKENNFYGYCARKIRDLMKVFPCEQIGLDSQGGGIAVMEALHDSDKLETGELPIWPIINPDKRQETDDYAGLHILELINQANADWNSEANHGLKKDLEDKVLLFPLFDTVSIVEANYEDKQQNTQYDTLEDCVWEIEELKDELTTILHTQTPNGRDRWDTPETKISTGKKGRLRKDRYTSLIISNMIARTIQRTIPQRQLDVTGGVAGQVSKYKGGELYTGPSWFTEGMSKVGEFGLAVNRNR